MIQGKEVMSLTLARSGSKGIPGKNIKKLVDKPLLGYSLEAANNSNYIDRIIVSTDSEKIAEVARDFRAEIPFIRPGELATDEAKSVDTIIHALNWLIENEDYRPDYVILNPATAPLKTTKDIDKALESLIGNNKKSLISLIKEDKHPYWMMEIYDNQIKPYDDTYLNNKVKFERRQDLPDIYSISGAIYIFTPELIIEQKDSYPIWDNTYPYIMPKERSVNIDDMLDWKLAEMILNDI